MAEGGSIEQRVAERSDLLMRLDAGEVTALGDLFEAGLGATVDRVVVVGADCPPAVEEIDDDGSYCEWFDPFEALASATSRDVARSKLVAAIRWYLNAFDSFADAPNQRRNRQLVGYLRTRTDAQIHDLLFPLSQSS